MQRNVEKADPKVKALPMDNKRARRPIGNLLLLAGGTGLLASGVFLGPAASLAGEAAEPLERLTELGLEPNLLMLAGTMLLGLWLVSKHIRLHVQTLMKRDQSERALTEMGADLAEFCNRLVEFQGDHLHFRTELEGMNRQITAHRQGDRSGEAADGLFRIAASFDQLGARMGGQMTESVGSMRHNVDELGGLVAASRDFLQESVEENGGKIRELQNSLENLAQEIRQIPAALQLAQAFVAGTGLPTSGPTLKADATLEAELEPEPDTVECFGVALADSIELDAGGLGLLDDIEAFDEEAEQSIFDDSPLAFFDRIENASNEERTAAESEPKEASNEALEEATDAQAKPQEQPVDPLGMADAIAPSTVPLEPPLPSAAPEAVEYPSSEQASETPSAPVPALDAPSLLGDQTFANLPALSPGPVKIDISKPAEDDPPGGAIGF